MFGRGATFRHVLFISKLSTYINPGLQVKEIGTIGLPLSVRDARAIAGVCKQSPFGKGDETIIDETVRKTWELDTTEFVCRNPAWNAHLDTLAKQAIQDLGVQVTASAQPYKLLLYEEGAFFKAHRDTEKVPGMFGTLVVCLPSEHTGGKVLLVHGNKQRTLETATKSAFELSALAWYSDVQHEIKPVMTGYRLVLTYNLVQDQTLPRQTAAALDATYARLGKLLYTWGDQFPHNDFFVYPLEHKYTKSSLSLGNLKGQDAAKGRYLEQLCSKHGVYWFLAQMTKEEQEDYYNDDDTTEIQLSQTFTPSGKRISLNLSKAHKDRILAHVDDLYGGRGPDSEDEGEYTGNENMPSTLRYHDTVAIMVRKDHTIGKFSIIEVQSVTSLLNMFGLVGKDRHCPVDLRRNCMTTILRKSLKMAIHSDDLSGNRDYIADRLLGYGAARESNRAEFTKVFTAVSRYCYLGGQGSVVRELLQGAMLDEHWATKKGLVDLIAQHMANETASGKADVWIDWLSVPLPPVPTYKYAKERRNTFETIKKTLPPASLPSFNEWQDARLHKFLQAVGTFTLEDVEPLLELLPVIAPETYSHIILPCLMKNTHRPSVSRFLHLLAKQTTSDALTCETITKPTYQQLLHASASDLKLPVSALTAQSNQHVHHSLAVSALTHPYQHAHHSLPVSALTSQPYQHAHHSQPVQGETSAVDFLSIIDHCMKLKLEGEAEKLLNVGLPDLPAATLPFWSSWRLLLNFIGSLIEILGRYNNIQLNNAAVGFIIKVLQSTSSFLASTIPKKPRDWCRPHKTRRGCSCAPCTTVKAFLMDPTQPVGFFSYNQTACKHIKSNFLLQIDYTITIGTTLVVQKTTPEYANKLRQWEIDNSAMRSKLAGLRSNFLSTMLGGDVMQVAGLDHALAVAGAADGTAVRPLQHAQPLQHASASAQNRAPLTPAKRKADVIDLTEGELG